MKVVEEKEYIRVGGRQPIKTNARFIFATNKNIKELVAVGKFREDLYMRIAALELEVPSLDERKEDLPDIIESICARIRKEKPDKKMSFQDMPSDFTHFLMRDGIQGNIRGIQNILERFATFTHFDKQGFPDYRNWKSVIGISDTPRRKSRDGRMRLEEFKSIETDFLGDDFPGYKKAQQMLISRSVSGEYSKATPEAETIEPRSRYERGRAERRSKMVRRHRTTTFPSGFQSRC